MMACPSLKGMDTDNEEPIPRDCAPCRFERGALGIYAQIALSGSKAARH